MLARISAAVLSLVYVDKPESVSFFLKKSHYVKKTVMLDIVVIILGFNSIHRQLYDRKLILRQ